MKYRILLFSAGLLLGCAAKPPLGDATRKAFAAQAAAGTRPDGASRLTTEEARAILGEERGSVKRPTPKGSFSSQPREKTPLNPDASSNF